MSFLNDVTYKRLTLSMLFDWQAGGVAQNQTLSLYDCNGLAPDQATPVGQGRYNACNTYGTAGAGLPCHTIPPLPRAGTPPARPPPRGRWVGGGPPRARLTRPNPP